MGDYPKCLLFSKDMPAGPGNRAEKLVGALARLTTAEFFFD
jgi:hypothetical protein